MLKASKIKTSWDLSFLFKSDDDPKIEEERAICDRVTFDFINKWRSNTSYLTDPKTLKDALDEYESFWRFYGSCCRELFYYNLKNALDQGNADLKAKLNKAIDRSKAVDNDLRFFVLSLSKIGKEEQERFLSDPGLSKYKHFLERIFETAKYTLGEAEEKVLSLKSDVAFLNWVRMTEEFLSKEERVVLDEDGENRTKGFEELLNLLASKSKKVRDGAAIAINNILEKHSDVAEHELNSVLKDKQINDELRGFPRSDTSRHVEDDIESDIVDALIDSVKNGFVISQRYYSLKAKMLGVKRISYHERNVEVGEVGENYNYNESIDLIYRSLNNLDKEFGDIFVSFIQNGQIDAFPKKGKCGGAFCTDMLPVLPTYILLNHSNKLRNVLTIAHEVGHGINFEMMKGNCSSLDFDFPKSTAEVASTFMEDFVFEEMLKVADEETQLVIMMQKLHDIISSVQRQSACYLFEQEIHKEFREKGYLSKKEIGELFQKNMSAYMGTAVEQSEGSQNWWVYWSHIRSYFYVYSYSSGLLISKALQNMIRNNPKDIEKVKYFFAAGASDSPKRIFEKVGVDITKKEFWENGLGEIGLLLDQAEKLAKKLNKI